MTSARTSAAAVFHLPNPWQFPRSGAVYLSYIQV